MIHNGVLVISHTYPAKGSTNPRTGFNVVTLEVKFICKELRNSSAKDPQQL
jgi:hypothetical protein